MSIFILLVSAGALLEGNLSLWVSLSKRELRNGSNYPSAANQTVILSCKGRYGKIQVKENRFCPHEGKHELEITRILAYFTQWDLKKYLKIRKAFTEIIIWKNTTLLMIRFTCSLDCDIGKLNLVLRIKNNT